MSAYGVFTIFCCLFVKEIQNEVSACFMKQLLILSRNFYN